MNILITGGASGLGEAITVKLASNNDNLVYFTYAKSKDNAKKIVKKYKNAIPIKCDFKSKEELNFLLAQIEGIDLDVLINNAYTGVAIKTHFHKVDSSDFLIDFENNVIPIIKISQAVISKFRKVKRGKIITILTSYLINQPPIGSSSYVSCKAYIEKLTKSWANENAKFNIQSNSVSPSMMRTSLIEDVDVRLIEQSEQNHPLKKLLEVEDVADTVYFLTSASSHINRIDIPINSATNIK